MPFPTTAFGVVTVILLLVPGLVYAVARRHLKGFQYDDLSKDARIAQALIVSLFLDTIYLLVASQWLGDWVEFKSDQAIVKAPSWVIALAVLVGGFVVPWLMAIVLNAPYRIIRLLNDDALETENGQDAHELAHNYNSSRIRKLTLRVKVAGKWIAKKFPFRIERTAYYHPVPNAWDWGAREPRHRWVRVTLPNGYRVGGFFGPGSYVSTYPEPRDIFISHQYHLKDDGSWGPMVEATAGLWLKIGDDHIVEFLDP
jgi:hypothetical protein